MTMHAAGTYFSACIPGQWEGPLTAPAESSHITPGQLVHGDMGRSRGPRDMALRRAVPDRSRRVARLEVGHVATLRRLPRPEWQDLLLQGEDDPTFREQEDGLVARSEGHHVDHPEIELSFA
jgi:hypothetical protein